MTPRSDQRQLKHDWYRNDENPAHLAEIARLWNVEHHPLPVGPQTHIMETLDRMEEGRIGLLWVICTNPAVSLPNRNQVVDLLRKSFLVVEDPFLSETDHLADVVLPTAIWGRNRAA